MLLGNERHCQRIRGYLHRYVGRGAGTGEAHIVDGVSARNEPTSGECMRARHAFGKVVYPLPAQVPRVLAMEDRPPNEVLVSRNSVDLELKIEPPEWALTGD